ncbi:MAG: tRNA uridine(34) 5-carboxymethylaminomethyl modification radical SAM/GNAT enzyme Elp3 [Chloroflexota bacterium]
MRKATRTLSGVTPVAVMARPMGCPGRCVYCPSFPDIPRSYTTASPAVLRGRRADFDPRRQVAERLATLEAMGHPTDKVELIIMGGTFLAAPLDYQYRFIQGCYEGLNGAAAGGLDEARDQNQGAPHRCVGLCVETRPDFCGEDEVARLLEFGGTRVELGVQTLDEGIYALVRRGHTVEAVVSATRLLRERGFKVHYHWMPGLPGSTPERDMELLAQLFSDPRFRPDGLKLYPTLVVQGSELEAWWREGRYRPYDTETLVELLCHMKAMLPPYVRVSRIMRDIPSQFIVAGCQQSNLGEVVARRLGVGGCQCIRCREYGHRLRDGGKIGDPRLRRLDYEACGGREVFLSMEDEGGTLFGLLRLRYPFEGPGAAVVRELHVYGPEVGLGLRAEQSVQHRGLGETLLREAERVAREEFGASELAVLSGVGAREYYLNLGYQPRGPHMFRTLSTSHPPAAPRAVGAV